MAKHDWKLLKGQEVTEKSWIWMKGAGHNGEKRYIVAFWDLTELNNYYFNVLNYLKLNLTHNYDISAPDCIRCDRS